VADQGHRTGRAWSELSSLPSLVDIQNGVAGTNKDCSLDKNQKNATDCRQRVPIPVIPNGLGDLRATSMGAYKVTPGLNAPIESVAAKMQTASDEGEKIQLCQNHRGGTWPTSTVWTGCENAAWNPLQWNLFADVRALSGNDQIVRQRMRRLFEGPLFGDFRGSHEVPEVAEPGLTIAMCCGQFNVRNATRTGR